jgi:hypothetical protein
MARWTPEPDALQVSTKPQIVPGLYECTMTLPLPGGSARALAEAEQAARDCTFVPTQLDAADRLFFIPPDHVRAETPVAAESADADALELGALRPAGVPHLYVLGAMADVPRAVAAELARELNLACALFQVGDRDGKGAAILNAYANDPRGFYANYARRVLDEKAP